MKKYSINGVDFISINDKDFCKIDQCGITVLYPFEKPKTDLPIKYVLMDLDGTTVKSEEFWMYLIELTIKKFSGNADFRLCEEDVPYVSGFSTIEHLEYCIKKYKLDRDVDRALNIYHETAKFELNEILEGRGNIDAFKPRTGIRNFLLLLKEKGVKIGLVTSGLDYKAIPEIVSAFRVLDMGDPLKFYDAIITGGRRKEKGEYGTVGEIAAKPHPWVYSEIALGLGISDKSHAIVLEDSSAGLIAARLAGFNVVGFKDGNLIKSGLDKECLAMVDSFDEIVEFFFR